jgi:hypothetical protein
MAETETKFDKWVTRIYFGFMFSTPLIFLLLVVLFV